MKLVFVSNFFNLHQSDISNNFYKYLNGNYNFIETTSINNDRRSLGQSFYERPSYVLSAYENQDSFFKCCELINLADVVIVGSAPDKMIVNRLKNKKLTFKYSERPYKNGVNWKTLFHIIIGSYLHHGRFQKYPLYLLCSSAYAYGDYLKFGNYKKKAFNWGYFPKLIYYPVDMLVHDKEIGTIVWVARYIPLKHPEIVIDLAKALKDKGYNFRIKMIGNGEFLNKILESISNYNLKNFVSIMGALSPEQVREEMVKSSIFIFTSDFQEGWGAVLNEAMNSGCACVVSHAVGAAPFLIQDGVNGFLYQNGNMQELVQKVSILLDNRELGEKMGGNAYNTITKEWNACIAAQRFIKLCEKILHGENHFTLPKSGPCSKSYVLKNNWYGEN